MDMNVPQSIMNLTTQLDQLQHPTLEQPRSTDRSTEFFFSEQLSASLDVDLKAMWLRWNPSPRPNFNPDLLHDLARYCDFLTRSRGRIESGAGSLDVDYAVLSSGVEGVFNLGGDLNLFIQHIKSRDHASLLNYGRACIDVLYRNYISHGLPISTISLVQGECLGGGFEAALSSDVLIAERSSRFGFPEIMFNLFPGMGAYSFLQRKIGRHETETLIGSGKIYSAEEMMNLGVVDVVVDDGEGQPAVADFIRARKRSHKGLAGLAAARRCVHKLEYEELNSVVEAWADTALRLSERDLRLMQKIVSRQTETFAKRSLH
jgi:DSF synthase